MHKREKTSKGNYFWLEMKAWNHLILSFKMSFFLTFLVLLFCPPPLFAFWYHSGFPFFYMFPSKLPFHAAVVGSVLQCWSVTACILLHEIPFLMLVSTPANCKYPILIFYTMAVYVCFSCVSCGGIFLGIIEVYYSSRALEGKYTYRAQQIYDSHPEPMELLKKIVSLFKYFHEFLKMVAYIVQIAVCMIASAHSFQSCASQDIYRSM